ncbi:hypothetical protein E2C01_062327 [Portunus trituberculatus]|uniref:Uncharacterized protein n=1 Tax=Portunus trituberculatus TaxID=210409 RepID=A0A5B7HAT7_PORTR|nr:hypothetical protein [Portunus trituberculatus]
MARSDYGLAHGCLGAYDTGRGLGLTGELGPCITPTWGPNESYRHVTVDAWMEDLVYLDLGGSRSN